METQKAQPKYVWPEGVMPPEKIKSELEKKGLNLTDLSLRIENVSYDTVLHTIAGRKKNPKVLQYLSDLGINHGRTPGKSRGAEAA